MELSAIFGLLGAMTASTIFFPQVLQTYKTKRTLELSWLTIVIGVINGFVWTIYGFMKADPFIYVTNILASIATLMLVVMKKKYDKKG